MIETTRLIRITYGADETTLKGYTIQKPVIPLSDDEIYELSQLHLVAKLGSCGEPTGDVDGEIDFARAIERAHGIYSARPKKAREK
jgi:hypothetical protein